MNFTKNLKSYTKKRVKALRHAVFKNFNSFSAVDFQKELGKLGIAVDDTVLVHSSFDAFEGFQGKPTDVISSLQGLVGEGGILMMPTMTFSGTAVDYARANPVVDLGRSPSRMGLLTELFRRTPDVIRSVHPTHPMAVWGRDANLVAHGHHLAKTPCGVGTPFEALLKRQGKIILLGTDISVLTFFHMLEEALESDFPVAPFTEEVFHLNSKTRDGEILSTSCRLFEPSVSRRRNLHKMVPYLKKAGAWHQSKVGGLEITVLGAANVDKAVRGMIKQGVYCYD